MAQREYIIPITRKTLEVWKVTGANPTDAAMKLQGLILGGAEPFDKRELSIVVGAPRPPVADGSVDADGDRPEDHEDGEADDDTENEPADSAHAGTVPTVEGRRPR